MPTSGNQSTRQRNLPILGSDSAWSQQCFSCGMVRAAQSCPPTSPTPTHSTANLFLRPEQNQNRAGPFSLAELKTHDEVLSGFWKQQGLVIYSWSKIGNRLIFSMEGINCVLSCKQKARQPRVRAEDSRQKECCLGCLAWIELALGPRIGTRTPRAICFLVPPFPSA